MEQDENAKKTIDRYRGVSESIKLYNLPNVFLFSASNLGQPGTFELAFSTIVSVMHHNFSKALAVLEGV